MIMNQLFLGTSSIYGRIWEIGIWTEKSLWRLYHKISMPGENSIIYILKHIWLPPDKVKWYTDFIYAHVRPSWNNKLKNMKEWNRKEWKSARWQLKRYSKEWRLSSPTPLKVRIFIFIYFLLFRHWFIMIILLKSLTKHWLPMPNISWRRLIVVVEKRTTSLLWNLEYSLRPKSRRGRLLC